MSDGQFNHRICETCWTGAIGLDSEGRIRTAVQVRDPEPQPCCRCGELCIWTGIYFRAPVEDDRVKCGGQHREPWSWSQVATEEAPTS